MWCFLSKGERVLRFVRVRPVNELCLAALGFRRNQGSVELTANLSTYLIAGEEYNSAHTVLTQHLAKNPDRYEIQYNLACNSLATGDFLPALRTLQHAMGAFGEVQCVLLMCVCVCVGERACPTPLTVFPPVPF